MPRCRPHALRRPTTTTHSTPHTLQREPNVDHMQPHEQQHLPVVLPVSTVLPHPHSNHTRYHTPLQKSQPTIKVGDHPPSCFPPAYCFSTRPLYPFLAIHRLFVQTQPFGFVFVCFGLLTLYPFLICYHHLISLMIRLKPSELTLTPADVEETRRRMERRQAANAHARARAHAHAHATLPKTIHGPSMPPTLGAYLRRGPIRSRDESLTSLADTSVLTPHQAVTSFVDEPEDLPGPTRGSITESSETVSTHHKSSPLPLDHAPLDPTYTATGPVVSLPRSDIRLPFRPALDHGEPALFTSQEETDRDDPSSPPKIQLSLPRLGRLRTNSSEPGNDDSSPSRSPYESATDGNNDNAATPQTPMVPRTRSLCQHSVHVPSPLQHVQRIISSPRYAVQTHEEINTT